MTRLLLLLALLPSLAQATTAVVFDPAVGEKAVSTAWIEQHGSDVAVRYVSVDTIFDPSAPAIVLGDVDATLCEGEPADRAAFQALSKEADNAAFGMEYLSASAVLGRLERLLPCLTEVPDSTELSHFHLLRGVVAWYAQGEAEATRRFKEALLVTPFLQWNTRYPPELRPSFEEAVRSALHAEKAFFSVSPRIVDEGTFTVNGLAFDPRTRTANLYEGSHLLQWVPTSGTASTWHVEVKGGQFVTLVHRQDALDDLLTGRADAGVTEFAMTRVLAPVEREAVSSVAVAQDWDVMLFHRFDVVSKTWRLADLAAIDVWRRTGRTMRGVGAGLIAGGVVSAIVGGVFWVPAFNDAKRINEHIDQEGYWADIGTAENPNLQRASLGELSEHMSPMNTAQDNMRVGLSLGIIGGALTVAGVPITIVGDRRARAAGLSTRQSSAKSRKTAPKKAKTQPNKAKTGPKKKAPKKTAVEPSK
jgi:hypothetical protein